MNHPINTYYTKSSDRVPEPTDTYEDTVKRHEFSTVESTLFDDPTQDDEDE